jgi:hypothetical protein
LPIVRSFLALGRDQGRHGTLTPRHPTIDITTRVGTGAVAVAVAVWLSAGIAACRPATETWPGAPLDESITAEALIDAYTAGETAARARFGDRWLAVTGTVTDIDRAALSSPYVTMVPPGHIFGVQATFVRVRDDAAVGRMTRGQRLTVRCRHAGRSGSIALRDCSIVR